MMSYNRQITISCEGEHSIDCRLEAALAIIGGKWKLKIYQALASEMPLRFSALVKKLTGISDKTLTAQLREMEADGIIDRAVYAEIPPRVEYQLTALGNGLAPVCQALEKWAEVYLADRKR
jgi:DNA-binding HxlR family transcriptional regulator